MIHIFNGETKNFILFCALHSKVEPGPESTKFEVGKGIGRNPQVILYNYQTKNILTQPSSSPSSARERFPEQKSLEIMILPKLKMFF
jgi:hypothetical protein